MDNELIEGQNMNLLFTKHVIRDITIRGIRSLSEKTLVYFGQENQLGVGRANDTWTRCTLSLKYEKFYQVKVYWSIPRYSEVSEF